MSRRCDREGVEWPRGLPSGNKLRLRAWVYANAIDRGEALREPGDLLFGSVVRAHLREPVALPSDAGGAP